MAAPVEVCLCGSFDFERVIVERVTTAPLLTDFLACSACKAMYFAPVDRGDGHADFMRQVRELAKEYVKPGRHKPPRRG